MNDEVNEPEPDKLNGTEQTAEQKEENEDPASEEPREEETPLDEAPALSTQVSHFRNAEAHPAWLRYGIPLWLIATFVLLLNADIGSGVSADWLLYQNEELVERRSLFEASIFSSVKELWSTQSYPLAIFIVITSICWPYLKLLLSMYAWMRPFPKPRRRELLLEVIDCLGKWSFAEIVVLVEIMVAFRSKIELTESGSIILEIAVIPQWGFFGFVFATMMSLLATHIILYRHRQVLYHSNEEQKELQEGGFPAKAGLSARTRAIIAALWVIGVALFFVGCFLDIYEVRNSTGEEATGITTIVDRYSVISIGQAIPNAVPDPSNGGIRFIQAMWYFLCFVMPLWCSLLFAILYTVPLSQKRTEWTFLLAEVAFSWSCAEVLIVATISAVLQLPTFGDGLIEADCQACFVVDSDLLPDFACLVVGAVLNVVLNIWLYRKAHHVLYSC